MSTLTIAMNTETYATSQYTNYPFNSYCKFNGAVLGASSGGIFQIDKGNIDHTSHIDMLVEFPKTDLGSLLPKHVRRVSVGGRTHGNLLLTAAADDGPEQTKTLRARNPGRYSVMFETLSRNQRGTFFAFRLENIDGAYCSIDSIDLDIVPVAMRETPA